jgi:hypothetical protein
VQGSCIPPDLQYPEWHRVYPYGEFDSLAVVELNYLLEIAGIDSLLLCLVELVVDVFD